MGQIQSKQVTQEPPFTMSQSTWTHTQITESNSQGIGWLERVLPPFPIPASSCPLPNSSWRSNWAASTSRSSRTFLINLSTEAHVHESRTSPAGQRAKSTEHFQHACSPGHQASRRHWDAKEETYLHLLRRAHRWAGELNVILDLRRAGSAQVLGPLLTRNTHKPSRLRE